MGAIVMVRVSRRRQGRDGRRTIRECVPPFAASIRCKRLGIQRDRIILYYSRH